MTSETKLDLHPDAAANFRDRGERLFGALQPLEQPQPDERFTAQRHPVATWTNKDLPPRMLEETVDRLTMEVTEIAFLEEQESLVLSGDDCAAVDSLAEALQSTTDFKPRISRTFLRRRILDWLEEKIDGTVADDLPTYILEKSTAALETFEVWVPIANLAIEREVRLDPIHVRPLSRETLDSWFANWKSGKPTADHALLDEGFEKLRAKIQGLAASVITLRAEGLFAVQKGLEKAEDVAAIFRLLHPANSHPKAVFYCRPLGRENIETHLVLLAERNILKSRIEATTPPMPDIWELSGEQLKVLERDFASFRSLLQIGNRSEFSKAALDAILLYSRSTMAREPSDKLIFIFAALESMLLKNATEPLQSSGGDRLAFLVGSSPEERKQIAGALRTVYSLRSKFVHHGRKTPPDLEILEEFMGYAWRFFRRLPHLAERFQEKLAFIEAIDHRRYS